MRLRVRRCTAINQSFQETILNTVSHKTDSILFVSQQGLIISFNCLARRVDFRLCVTRKVDHRFHLFRKKVCLRSFVAK